MTPYLKDKTLFPALIETAPTAQLGTIVVIPAYDEPNLTDSLQALANCNPPAKAVEVIVVINHAAGDTPSVKVRNQAYFESAKEWATQFSQPWLQFHILYLPNLPNKQAGVGLARKIGMDEACQRLEQVGQPHGIILGFDADSSCDPNYFQVVERYFQKQLKMQAAGIYFEHPLTGREFTEDIYQAITEYELHLRYFINAQHWAGLPYAYQTIGSSMAVRCSAYQQQGGMNRRKAGEDFYFLHKFTPLGYFGQINDTRVIPSPRPSQRVPFGTGRAIGQLLENGLNCETYAPDSFVVLRHFIRQVPYLYQDNYVPDLHEALLPFLTTVNFEKRLAEMRRHTSSEAAFCKRFFRWFDAFMLMKYAHFIRDHLYPNVPLRIAANWLTQVSGYRSGRNVSEKELLLLWRSIDRNKT